MADTAVLTPTAVPVRNSSALFRPRCFLSAAPSMNSCSQPAAISLSRWAFECQPQLDAYPSPLCTRGTYRDSYMYRCGWLGTEWHVLYL